MGGQNWEKTISEDSDGGGVKIPLYGYTTSGARTVLGGLLVDGK